MSEQTFTGTLGNQEWRVRLELDQSPANPRTDMDNAWTLVCAHRKYTLGDRMIKDAEEMKDVLASAGLNRKTALVVPIYMLDHSGLALSRKPFNDRWDSGQIGEAFIDRAKLKDDFDGNRDKALAALDGELETYQSYLGGDVYGVVYETRPAGQFEADDTDEGWEHESSCWGYYGENDARAAVVNLVPAEVNQAINPPTPVAAPRRRRQP